MPFFPFQASGVFGLVLILLLFIFVRLLIGTIRKHLRGRMRTKHQRHNLEIFTRIIWYLFVILACIIVAFSFSADWKGLGVSLGLLSAALGWALQKPITAIAAWIMVVVSRMFRIGDRVIIGSTRGDVVNLTLTHVYLKEVGGVLQTEEVSGRIVMLPNNLLFDMTVVNYTLEGQLLISEVGVTVTYESNVDAALEICLGAAKEVVQKYHLNQSHQPYTYMEFQQSGVFIRTRFFVPAAEQDSAKSLVSKRIFDGFSKQKDVRIAVQQQEVLLRK